MKLFKSSLLSIFLVGATNFSLPIYCNQATSSPIYGNKIEWFNDYEAAVQQAKMQSLPIILFFTGSDWCSWCKKFEDEILSTPQFAEAMQGKFIFVRLDYPMKTSLDPKTTTQNKQLKNKYKIQGFPTLVLLDENEREIGTSFYQPGGGKKYAEHLQQMIHSKN